MGTTTHSTAALHQAAAIQHRMNSTFRRDGNTGEAPQQALTNFASTPAGVLMLYVQDEIFDLERKSVGVAIRTSASVREPLHAAFLVTIEDLIAGLAGDAKLPAKFRHRLAGEPQTAVFHPLPNTPSKAALPPLYGEKCHLCVRYNVLPMSQAAHPVVRSEEILYRTFRRH